MSQRKKFDPNLPCIRCGKLGYKIGKISEYGQVCNSCAVYFREPRPCPICGELSNRLSKYAAGGFLVQVCPRCARTKHATCPACRHHRLLQLATDGRMLCKSCSTGEIKHCSTCDSPMPAGRGKTCGEDERKMVPNKTSVCAADERRISAIGGKVSSNNAGQTSENK